ncbi:nuclear envelope protein [Arthroderma uncinatum]|uniref:nuclear envelope protein n=1 Tax=Arthroderma uncinatum TaxID=74035 RepID=UPI00144A545A|nr:nuclear envelope protein [Arthroderma uncinatum]KAF3491889.1 nuclear envelope protein [Arthroderma uncinatum]
MHVGARIAASHFHNFRLAALSFNSTQTVTWYLFSAWWFSEVYKWSSSADAKLNWVIPGKSYERSHLNERPIYLHCFFILLALVQSSLHLYFDWDEVPIPVTKRTQLTTSRRTHRLAPLPTQFSKIAPEILRESAIIGCITAAVGPIVYMFLFRRTAWSWTLYFAKLFWNFPRSAADPPGLIPPIHISILIRSATSGSLLVMLWQISNFLFSAFLGQAPLKKGQPLTNGAADPNGSLINGLKSKKETVMTFAFWELCLISQEFPDRRKQIFKDIDRNGGSAWNQILKASEEVIKGITGRIQEFQNPQPQATVAPVGQKEPQPNTQEMVQTLPRITQPSRNENILLGSPKPGTRTEKFEAAFGPLAKSYGQSQDWTPAAKARARSAIDRASNVLLNPEQKRTISNSAQELKLLTSGPETGGVINPIIQQVMRSPLGLPFRQSFPNRLRGIVLGSPHSKLAAIIDATESLKSLLIASLEEDQFGRVQADVPTVVKLFTQTITTLESFTSKDGLKPHWSDVDVANQEHRSVEQVEIVITALKTGLSELLGAFSLYLNEVGVVGRDLQLAREAVRTKDV